MILAHDKVEIKPGQVIDDRQFCSWKVLKVTDKTVEVEMVEGVPLYTQLRVGDRNTLYSEVGIITGYKLAF